jgi:hypothetical protein
MASSFPAASCATRAVSKSPAPAAAKVAAMSVARRVARRSLARKPGPVAFFVEGSGICRESVGPRSYARLAVSIGTVGAGSTDADRASSSALRLPGSLGQSAAPRSARVQNTWRGCACPLSRAATRSRPSEIAERTRLVGVNRPGFAWPRVGREASPLGQRA